MACSIPRIGLIGEFHPTARMGMNYIHKWCKKIGKKIDKKIRWLFIYIVKKIIVDITYWYSLLYFQQVRFSCLNKQTKGGINYV